MIRAERAGTGLRLRAADIARACGGRVLRAGGPARSVTTDTRTLEPGACFVALRGPTFDGHDYLAEAFARGAAGAVVGDGTGRRDVPEGAFLVRVDDTTQALGRLAAAHRGCHGARVVGITGSCGQTTTKDMLGAVLSSAMPTIRSPSSFNNAIGVPLTLFQLRPDTRAAVVEIGTSEPGEVARLGAIAAPDVAIVTCVAEAHLEGLGSLGGVAREKASLLDCLRPGGVAILNGDDASCRAMAEQLRRTRSARVLTVRLDARADWFATEASFGPMGTTFLLQGERAVTVPMLGTHSVYNALLTIAAATELGVDLDSVIDALCVQAPSRRRLEPKVVGDVVVFDDTYNMNPASARAGLRALAGMPRAARRVVVFGEMAELGPASASLHRALGGEVAATADLLITVGGPARDIAAGAREAGLGVGSRSGSGDDDDAVVEVADATAALEVLVDRLRPGDHVLCKASRRAALDQLVDALVGRLSRTSQRATRAHG